MAMTLAQRLSLFGSLLLAVVLGLGAFWIGGRLRKMSAHDRDQAVLKGGQLETGPASPRPATQRRIAVAPPPPPAASAAALVGPVRSQAFEPKAFREYAAQRKQPHAKPPEKFYAAEARDPIWAPKMEQQIQSRFDPGVLTSLKISGLKIEKLDCRTSSCRMVASWTLDDLNNAHDHSLGGEGADPLVLLGRSTGPLAAMQRRLTPASGQLIVPGEWSVVRRLDGRFYAAAILMFDDWDIDPERYREAMRAAANNMLPLGTEVSRTDLR